MKDKIGMEYLTARIVPEMRRNLQPNPNGNLQSDKDRLFAFDTAGALIQESIDGLKGVIAQDQATVDRVEEALARCELGEEARRTLAEYRGHNREQPANDPEQSNTTLALEFLQLAQPVRYLRFNTVLTAGGMVVFGGADILAVGHAMKQRSLDALGNFNGSMFELVGLSLFTLFIYWAIGLLWQHGVRHGAAVLYVFVVGILMIVLWPDESTHARELWDGLRQSASNNLFAADQPAPASPLAFQFGYVGMWALVYTVAGLLFIWSKSRFGHYLNQWRMRSAAQTIKDLGAAAHDLQSCIEQNSRFLSYLENNTPQIGRYLFRVAQEQEFSDAATKRDALRAKSRLLTASQATKEAAKAEADQIDAWLRGSAPENDDDEDGAGVRKTGGGQPRKPNGPATVMTLLLVAGGAVFSPLPAHAETSAQLCAAAPSFTLMIDTSGSSPAQYPEFLQSATREIENKIRTLPVCSKIYVFTVGDGRTLPLMFRATIFMRSVPGQGGTKDDIIRAVRQLLARMPEEIKRRPQGRSELLGAWEDCARNFNPNATTPNIGMMLSDGVEASSYANCERRACTFPKPRFSLAGAEIILLGIGQGLPAEKAASLSRTWESWFAQTGINGKTFRVARVF